MNGEEGKVTAIPPSPKPLISDPRQMRRDDFWGRLAPLLVLAVPPEPRPVLCAAGAERWVRSGLGSCASG